MKRRDSEQLNAAVPPASEEPVYSLEDIMREFAPQAEQPPSGDTVAFRPILGKPPEPRLDEPMKVAGPAGAPPTLYPDAPVQSPPEAKLPAQEPPPEQAARPRRRPVQPEPVSPPKPQKAARAAKAPKRVKAPKAPQIRPAPPVPTPGERLQALQRSMHPALLRLWLSVAVTVVNVLLMLCHALSWQFLPLSTGLLTGLSMALLVLCLLLSREVVLDALRELLHLHPAHTTLGLLAALLTLADAALNGEPGYCAVASALLCYLSWGLFSERSAHYHTLRTVCALEQPVGIYNAPQLLRHSDSLRRGEANQEEFMLRLGVTDLPRRMLRIYATILLPAAPVAAWFLSGLSGSSFLRCWLLLLLCGLPFSCGLCYGRPFVRLARRLRRMGGALCGWHSARILRGQHTLVLRDEDIFPHRHIVSSGMKIYGSHPPALVIGYALAALRTIDSPLVERFDALLRAQYGRSYIADSYRTYQAGGVGVEVNGDIVLVGTLRFMRAMGVHMPDGTRVQQAVYVSIGGELAGIFALKYKPSASTRLGLLQLAAKPNVRVVLATRDFLITPELIAARYELPTSQLVFPDYEERLRLSETRQAEPVEQAALIGADTFGAFASAVAAGQMLRSSALLNLWLNALAGLIGLALCVLLLLWGAAGTASPLHIGIFQLLWSILTSFATFIALRP